VPERDDGASPRPRHQSFAAESSVAESVAPNAVPLVQPLRQRAEFIAEDARRGDDATQVPARGERTTAASVTPAGRDGNRTSNDRPVKRYVEAAPSQPQRPSGAAVTVVVPTAAAPAPRIAAPRAAPAPRNERTDAMRAQRQVHVHIGAIEVRATPPTKPAELPPPAARRAAEPGEHGFDAFAQLRSYAGWGR
jgi:hypothetical protein